MAINGSRCTFMLEGLGRCYDESGEPHGHHFRPQAPDQDLYLTPSEARELVTFLDREYLNPNRWPLVYAMLDRLTRQLG